MSELERQLTQLGRELDWPPTPHISVREHLAPEPTPSPRIFRRSFALAFAALLGHAQREPRPAPRRSHAVARLVRHDREQPGPEGSPVAEARERRVRLHERVLCGLLRIRIRPRDHPRGPERDRLMQSHDLLVGIQLAALCARDELRFLGWPVLHRARTTTPPPDLFQPGPRSASRSAAAWLDPRRVHSKQNGPG